MSDTPQKIVHSVGQAACEFTLAKLKPLVSPLLCQSDETDYCAKLTDATARIVDLIDAERTAQAALIEELDGALRAYVVAQGRMLERWAENDAATKHELWVNLHACEAVARAVLARLPK